MQVKTIPINMFHDVTSSVVLIIRLVFEVQGRGASDFTPWRCICCCLGGGCVHESIEEEEVSEEIDHGI